MYTNSLYNIANASRTKNISSLLVLFHPLVFVLAMILLIVMFVCCLIYNNDDVTVQYIYVLAGLICQGLLFKLEFNSYFMFNTYWQHNLIIKLVINYMFVFTAALMWLVLTFFFNYVIPHIFSINVSLPKFVIYINVVIMAFKLLFLCYQDILFSDYYYSVNYKYKIEILINYILQIIGTFVVCIAGSALAIVVLICDTHFVV